VCGAILCLHSVLVLIRRVARPGVRSLAVVAADERVLIVGLYAYQVRTRMIAMRFETGSLAAELGR
jgi:hypothetical protein